MKEKKAARRLIKRHQTFTYDWMGYLINEKKEITYSHIIKKDQTKGLLRTSNGAILTKKAHSYLNYLEVFNPDLFEEFQEMFKEIVASKKPMQASHYAKLLKFSFYSEESPNPDIYDLHKIDWMGYEIRKQDKLLITTIEVSDEPLITKLVVLTKRAASYLQHIKIYNQQLYNLWISFFEELAVNRKSKFSKAQLDYINYLKHQSEESPGIVFYNHLHNNDITEKNNELQLKRMR